MIHLRFVRYGFASVLGLIGIGVLASCVSGTVDGGNGVDTGLGGSASNAAAGNVGTGNAASRGGSPPGTAGSASATAGAVGNGAQGGSVSSGGTASGTAGSPSTGGSGSSTAGSSNGTGGTSPSGTAGQGGSGNTGNTSSGTAGATGTAGSGATGPQPLPPISGGQVGFLSRFWDCCKPSCGGGRLTCGKDGTTSDGGGSACTGGSAYACYDLAPFVDSANPYVAYAFGATNPQECGACYEVQFTGKSGCSDSSSCPANSSTIVYNTLYIQGINTGSDVKSGQFDIMIPGGGVGIYNACSTQWDANGQSLGAQYGGFFDGSGSLCNGNTSCYNTQCNKFFANKPDMLAGCLWFSSWLKAASNPQITYTKVACPKQLTDKSGM